MIKYSHTTCANCHYSEPAPFNFGPLSVLHCRRYPPTQSDRGYTEPPKVRVTDWSGEFVQRVSGDGTD